MREMSDINYKFAYNHESIPKQPKSLGKQHTNIHQT